jgi:hypothetical protein
VKSWYGDQNVGPDDLHFVDLLVGNSTGQALACTEIEAPAMPRAGDFGFVDFAIGERASLVRADAINGKYLAISMK